VGVVFVFFWCFKCLVLAYLFWHTNTHGRLGWVHVLFGLLIVSVVCDGLFWLIVYFLGKDLRCVFSVIFVGFSCARKKRGGPGGLPPGRNFFAPQLIKKKGNLGANYVKYMLK
jgi:hypothetical protein